MSNPFHEALFGHRSGRDGTFLILPDGARISHAQFRGRAAQFARALGVLGVRPGDRVAVQAEKSADVLALYAACVGAGAVFLPLNTAYVPDEIDYFLRDAEPALFVAAPAAAARLAPVAEAAGVRMVTLGTAGDGSLAALADKEERGPLLPVARGAGDLAALLYTSGTTGRSKGAMLSQGNLLSNALVLAEAWRFTARDVLLHALPVFHTHGLFVATNVTLVAGGAMILMPRFDADEVFRLMPQATTMMGVPTFYTRLVADARLTRAAVEHMRLFVSGSAPLLAQTHRDFQAATGHMILERYGMTELNMATSNPYAGERRPGTVGMPLPEVELRIRDDAGRDLPPDTPGMIEVRGPNVFQGYWRMPEKTAEELRPDGWFITGDIGTQSADGYVTIVGRAKDLVISGGFNIYPAEVEAVIDAVEGVLESAVIGLPHDDLGEGVVAIVVPRPGAAPTADLVREACTARLARFKVPRRVVLVDALPRNAMGKVQKAELRRQHAGLFGERG
ncbi:MAG: malonyl-CoA synthase [Rubellimicrobium sp.]|nr:malonyl-CoA synthase [Rubellimicrobium sp.]